MAILFRDPDLTAAKQHQRLDMACIIKIAGRFALIVGIIDTAATEVEAEEIGLSCTRDWISAEIATV
jgi:hypothetical protein